MKKSDLLLMLLGATFIIGGVWIGNLVPIILGVVIFAAGRSSDAY